MHSAKPHSIKLSILPLFFITYKKILLSFERLHEFFFESEPVFSMFRFSIATVLFILFCQTAEAQNVPTLTNLANEAFDRLNQRREQIGLPALKRNSLLDYSAAAHANYIIKNHSINTEGHSETSGKPGYTGARPTQRMLKAGYIANSTSENMALISYPVGSLSTDNLIDAPYHRQSELGTYLEAGVAMTAQPSPAGSMNPEQYVYVINFGKTISDKNKRTEPFVYPIDGQRDVPADWIANESPNPVPNMQGQRIGYPISLSASPGETLQIKTFSLNNSSNNAVEGRLITINTADGKPLGDYAFWLPLRPLAYGATYQAQAQGLLNGKNFTKTWRFTTIEFKPLQLTPSESRLGSTPGSTLAIKISGGTGSNYEINYTSQSYQYMGSTMPNLSFFTAQHPAPDLIVLKRSDTPCTHNVSACKMMVKGKDSSGNEASLSLPID